MNLVPTKEVNLDHIRAEEIQFNMMVKRSEILAKSSLLPSPIRNKPSDVLIIMMMAQELDIPPLQALNGINVIQGKPVISPQLMIALIRSRLPNSFIKIEEDEEKCECTCTMGRDKSDKEQFHTAKWNTDKAEKMGLLIKDNWKKQLVNMLKWRAVGECARVIFPDILSGLYFPDEFQDGTLITDENGEFKGKQSVQPAPAKAEVVVHKQSLQYQEFMRKLAGMTDNYKNKEKLNYILKEFNVKSSKEIQELDDINLSEMCDKMDDYKETTHV